MLDGISDLSFSEIAEASPSSIFVSSPAALLSSYDVGAAEVIEVDYAQNVIDGCTFS